ILVLGFMVVVGAIGAAVIGNLSSGLNQRVALDKARDREYAADAAIQNGVGVIRAIPASSTYARPGLSVCSLADYTFNGLTMHVDCVGVPTVTRSGYLQRNVDFTACLASDVAAGACPSAKIIIRAQVNFQAVGSFASLNIQRTWVQSWSVNR